MMRIEMEVCITYNAGEKEAIIWSCYPAIWTKMAKYGIKPYKQTKECRWYKVPKRCISIRNPAKSKLGISKPFPQT